MIQHISAKDKEKIYDCLFHNSSNGIVVVNDEQKIIQLNSTAEKIFLLSNFDFNQNNFSTLLEEYQFSLDYKDREVQLKNNPRSIVSLSQYPITFSNGKIGKIIVIQDITEYKHIEKTLLREQERAQVTLQRVNDAVMITDVNGMIDYLNPVAETCTGWMQRESEIFLLYNDGTRFRHLLDIIDHPHDVSVHDGLVL